MPRREGVDLLTESHQVLGLAGEDHGPGWVRPVEQGADADGVPGGDEGIRGRVIDHQGELRVQPGEHLQAVLVEQGEQHLAVAAAAEAVALFLQLPPQGAEAVDLAVADRVVPVQSEGLHPRLREAHDGEPLEAEPAGGGFHNSAHIRAPGGCAVQKGGDLLPGQRLLGESHDRTHKRTS